MKKNFSDLLSRVYQRFFSHGEREREKTLLEYCTTEQYLYELYVPLPYDYAHPASGDIAKQQGSLHHPTT